MNEINVMADAPSPSSPSNAAAADTMMPNDHVN